ncbi:hypothetical protein [Nonomuraea sp. NPDC052265]|uniref:hypothetical protein n=1 Tax=Nonomuraea sp. NPDC052265 TaxID=3364374 RepID=UPI0037CB1189
MITPVYAVGETLHLSATVHIVSRPAPDRYVIAFADGRQTKLPLAGPDACVQVTRACPADGRPLPGQIWTDHSGAEWFACGSAEGSGPTMVSADGTSWSWQHLNNTNGPIQLFRDVTQPQNTDAACTVIDRP